MLNFLIASSLFCAPQVGTYRHPSTSTLREWLTIKAGGRFRYSVTGCFSNTDYDGQVILKGMIISLVPDDPDTFPRRYRTLFFRRVGEGWAFYSEDATVAFADDASGLHLDEPLDFSRFIRNRPDQPMSRRKNPPSN